MEFHFRQFSISQARTPMKTGTDGVLLGAWAKGDGKNKCLDIGTGTGLIALMLAQRYDNLEITAIEPHPWACEEATANFSRSPWNNRLHTRCVRLQDHHPDHRYDLIISNPPFYTTHVTSPDEARASARHTLDLSHDSLLRNVSRLLEDHGSFQVILPENVSQAFIINASALSLFLREQLLIRPSETGEINRRLMAFGRQRGTVSTGELLLRKEGKMTEAYRKLTGEYYLKYH